MITIKMSRFEKIYYISAVLSLSTIIMTPEIVTTIIKFLGGDSASVGLYSSITLISVQAAVILSPLIYSMFKSKKKMIVMFSILSNLGMLMVGLAIYYFSDNTAIYILFLALILYFFSMSNIQLPFNNFLRKNFDTHSRVAAMSRFLGIYFISMTLASFILKMLIDNGLIFPEGYFKMIVFGFIFFSLNTVNYLFIKDASDGNEKINAVKKKAFFSFFKNFKETVLSSVHNKSIRGIFIVGILLNAASLPLVLFLSIGYDKDYDMMQNVIARTLPIAMLIKGLIFFAFGKLSQKLGNKMILSLICVMGIIPPVIVILLPVKWYFMVIISSHISYMWFPYLLNELFTHCDDNTYTGYYTLFSLLSIPITIFMPLLGFIADINLSIFCVIIFILTIVALFSINKAIQNTNTNEI